MRARIALLCTMVAAGCSGQTGGDPCAAVTCAQGRFCVAGRCVTPDSGAPDLGVFYDGATFQDTGVGPDDSGAAHEGLDLTLPDAPPPTDTGTLPCPDPSKAAGKYSGTFVDALGGALGTGTVSFTLSASGPTSMTLTSGSVKGTALPGFKNYPITATLKGSVNCAAISTSMSGTLDKYPFSGKFTGTLVGTTASGLWDGKDSSGTGLAIWGTWKAARQ